MKWMHQLFCVALIATISFNTVKSDSCDYVECGALAALCAVSCVDPLDGACEACLGTAYSQCAGCFSLTSETNAVQALSGCRAVTALHCAAKVAECTAVCIDNGITSSKCIKCFGSPKTYSNCKKCLPFKAEMRQQQAIDQATRSLTGCSIITEAECAVKVAECTSTCVSDGLSSTSCTSCFGDLYSDCIGCVTFNLAVKSRHEAAIQGCKTSTWLKCGGEVAKCGAECYEKGITSQECIDCLGSSYETCKQCIPLKAEMTIPAINRGEGGRNILLSKDGALK